MTRLRDLLLFFDEGLEWPEDPLLRDDSSERGAAWTLPWDPVAVPGELGAPG